MRVILEARQEDAAVRVEGLEAELERVRAALADAEDVLKHRVIGLQPSAPANSPDSAPRSSTRRCVRTCIRACARIRIGTSVPFADRGLDHRVTDDLKRTGSQSPERRTGRATRTGCGRYQVSAISYELSGRAVHGQGAQGVRSVLPSC
jgi:hypothetical protein